MCKYYRPYVGLTAQQMSSVTVYIKSLFNFLQRKYVHTWLLKTNSLCALGRHLAVWQLSIVSVWAQHTSLPSFLLQSFPSSCSLCVSPWHSTGRARLSLSLFLPSLGVLMQPREKHWKYIKCTRMRRVSPVHRADSCPTQHEWAGCAVCPMLGTWLNPIIAGASILIFWKPGLISKSNECSVLQLKALRTVLWAKEHKGLYFLKNQVLKAWNWVKGHTSFRFIC